MTTRRADVARSVVALEQAAERRRNLRRKALRIVVPGLIVATIFYAVSAAMWAPALYGHLREVRAAMADPYDRRSLAAAHLSLTAALDELEGGKARVVALLPGIRQNVQALREVTAASRDTVGDLAALLTSLQRLQDAPPPPGRTIDLEGLRTVRSEVATVEDGFARVENAMTRGMSWWLLPPLWDRFERDLVRIEGARTVAHRVGRGLDLALRMLGDGGSRTHLILFMNNAEARGSGGIISSLGTLHASDGRLRKGRFYYYSRLLGDALERVALPKDLGRRYGRYGTAAMGLANASMSPDVAEVARLAGSAFKEVTGVETDGVILLDPRGLAALLPPKQKLRIPATGATLEARDLPRYVYSKAYEDFEGTVGERRDVLLGVGRALLGDLARDGISPKTSLHALGDALMGRHIQVVGFRDPERTEARELGLATGLAIGGGDASFVALQNFGGDKLDYWSRIRIRHSCRVVEQASGRCSRRVLLRNEAPQGLPRYVTQGRQKARLLSFLEVYVPASATLAGVEVDGVPVPYSLDREDDLQAVGFYLGVPRGAHRRVVVDYRLPPDDRGYSLTVMPQPLAHDPHLDVKIALPERWRDSEGRRVISFSGPLDRERTFTGGPPEPRKGISALWDEVLRFWSEPLLDS